MSVVQAKRSAKAADLGREQAKQYCNNIQERHGGELPFCFYTNGHEIFFWNLGDAPPQKVHGFPTRQDLERLSYLRKHKKPLTDELINTAIAGRDFQLQAIRSVMESIERKRRRFLLVMATGSGKTRTCIALVDALMRAGHVQRVLFLVDRIALRGQPSSRRPPTPKSCPCISKKSGTTSHRARTQPLFSTALDIISPPASPYPATSHLFISRPTHQSSTRSKTSGNICAATSSPTRSTKITTISSKKPAKHGCSSPTTRSRSLQSPHANGQRSIFSAVGIRL